MESFSPSLSLIFLCAADLHSTNTLVISPFKINDNNVS